LLNQIVNMRYFLKPEKSVLAWLLDHDAYPRLLPVFPEDVDTGLVVAHLLSGGVFAEVITDPKHVAEVCGAGIPLGRLYFQIPKSLLYSVCDGFGPENSGG
jgi:hypothetical protein